MSSGLSRRLGIGGLVGLALLAGAYVVTREPAPRIRVLWREGITAQQQGNLEARYLLLNGRDRLAQGSVAYDLLDTSRANIRRLVEDPAVADTNDIDRHTFAVEPGTDRGEEWTWVAYRVPGLRAVWARRALVVLLTIAALAGLRREWLLVLRAVAAVARHAAEVWKRHRRSPADSRDLFDAIPWRAAEVRPPAGGAGLLIRLAAALVLVLSAGPPVLETWEALALAAALLALVFGECRRGWWRLPTAAAVVLAALGVKGALPRADIAEAHNAFLLPKSGGPLEQRLPQEVFASFKAQFEALYPLTGTPVPLSWRDLGAGPPALYTKSTDAIWRPAKYTRQVDAIDFSTLAEFRGGFLNELNARNQIWSNFWVGELLREEMPFYVMYELTRASVGSRLRWKGQLFRERADGGFEEIRHESIGERAIEPYDAGKRVYAVFFPQRDVTFDFRFVPSPTLRVAGWAEALLTLLGLCTVVIVVAPRWPQYLRATSLFLVAYAVLMVWYPEPSAARLGKSYFPHGGGSDGLVYEAQGRTMALVAGSGQVMEAMKGVEAVFAVTPGTRYVRMVEKLVFGETNHLFALMLASFPLVMFYLLRLFLGALPAWIVTAGFLVVPVQHFSFMQYFSSGRAGYADWLGTSILLFGLTLLLYREPGAQDRSLAQVWTGGTALAAAACVRPHYGLAVAWVAAVYAWQSWRRRDLPAALVLGAGLALAFWVPFHNWYYGGALTPVTQSQSTSLDRGLVVRILAGDLRNAGIAAVDQITGWLWSPGFAYVPTLPLLQWPARVIRMVALVVTASVACAPRRRGVRPDLRLVAGAALWAHAAMFIVFGHHQRYLLAWDLSMIVLVVWLLSAPSPRPVQEVSPAA